MCTVFVKLKSYRTPWTMLVFAVLLTQMHSPAIAQKFKADGYGYVASPEFKQLIKDRNYQLVSAFDTITNNHVAKVLATIIKNDMPYYLDLDGSEVPYFDPAAITVKLREQGAQKQYRDAQKKYDQLTRFSPANAYLKNRVGDLYGLIRRSDNKVILAPEYRWLQCFAANYIILRRNGKYGVADTLGKMLIDPQYDGIEPCMTDTTGIKLFIANKSGLVTLVNRSGAETFPPKYNKITPISTDGVLYSITSENGELRYGLLSREGKILLEPYCRDFVNIANSNFLRTEKTGQQNEIGMATKQGKIILEPVYSYVSASVEKGFINFSKDGKQGLIDQSGKIVMDPFYDKVQADSINQVIIIALEQKSDKPFRTYKYGMADYHGKVKVPLMYDELQKADRYYLSKKDDQYFLIDRFGKILRSFPYSYMLQANKYLIAMDKNNRYGVVDLLGKVKIPFNYMRIEPAGGFYFAADNGIYTPENELVMKGSASNVSFTNNIPLRRNGIVAFRQLVTETLKDRYGNQYSPKR